MQLLGNFETFYVILSECVGAMARIVAKDLVGTMQSLGMAGSIAQACPGGFFGSKWLI